MAAYASSGSKWLASRLNTLQKGCNCGGVTLLQCSAAIVRNPDQPVIGTCPDEVAVQRRGRKRVHDATICWFRVGAVLVLAHARGSLPAPAGQVRADLLPVLTAIVRLPHGVRGKIQPVRIDRRECEWHRAQHAVTRVTRGHGADVRYLAGVAVVHRHLAAVNQIRVQRIGGGARRIPRCPRDASRDR